METKILKSNESSAEIIASIDDLVTQILVRLPVEPLVRFKLVSKRWLSLISNPEFIRRYGNPNRTIGMFFPAVIIHRYVYVPFFPNDSNLMGEMGMSSEIYIMHSSNGLLLCASTTEEDYFVYNPTTNLRSRSLPKLDGNIREMLLAFEPAKSLDPYRVVCVRSLESETHLPTIQYRIEIYYPETGVWRSSGVDNFITEIGLGRGVYCNGAIHWICSWGGDSLYFNVRDQVLHTMPNPPELIIERYTFNYHLWESCDHLHFIPDKYLVVEFNVYEMKSDYSEWFVKYRIDLSPGVSANPWMNEDGFRGEQLGYYFGLLSIVRGDQDQEKEDASFLVFRIQQKVIRYNISPKTFELLCEHEYLCAADGFRLPHYRGFPHNVSIFPV